MSSNYVVRRTSRWDGTLTNTIVTELNSMEDALDLMTVYAKEEQGLVDAEWCHVTGYSITVDEKWDDMIMTIAKMQGGDYERK